MIHIVHHNDLDGWAAAAVVAYFHGNECIRHYECSYDQPPPDIALTVSDLLYIVDFSYPNMPETAIWFDHHESAIKLHSKGQPGFRSTKSCAAVLAWSWFTSEPVPDVLDLVDIYDNWRFEPEDDAPALNKFMYHMTSDPITVIHDMLSNTQRLAGAIDLGRHLLKVERIRNKNHAERWSYVTRFQGHKVRVINQKCSSLMFRDIEDPPDVVAYLTWQVNAASHQVVSLYRRTHVTESLLDLFTGFSGHAGACGATLAEDLPWGPKQ